MSSELPPSGISHGERRRRVDEVFTGALELEGSERDAYLDGECRDDPALRSEVEALLAAAFEPDPFLEPGGAQSAGLLDEVGATIAAFEAGRRIGRYRVLHEIDRGGMGVVYLAERADGQFEQRVALKVVRQSAGEPDLARLVRERQILASLEHPNIARLYDGGVTGEGHPYFVMEHVDGEPIDVHCRRHALGLRPKLRLLVAACTAVEAAHRSLVVHRDLKPSNILVDGAGALKLLDFGIAKVLDPESATGASATVGGDALTLQYASPEQWRGERITVASDVYQLGLLAYELLAGTRPYDLAAVPLAEAGRLICEEEPPPPSRHRQLDRDLDAIVMTALAKEPARRYPSADRLRRDVERYLAGQPVAARGASPAYRVGKFVRRHAAAVLAATAFALLLIGFATSRGLQQARTASERDKAEAVKDFVLSLFEASNPVIEVKGDAVTARELLERGVARIDAELAGQPETRAEVLAVVGTAYRELGRYERAEPLLASALALRREVLGEEHPDVAESLEHLAALHYAKGDYDASEPLYRQALAIQRKRPRGNEDDIARSLNDLSVVVRARRDLDQAGALAREALAMRRRLHGEEHPEVAESLVNIAVPLYLQADYEEAEALYREALAMRRRLLGDGHPHVAATMNRLALLLRRQLRYEEAEPLFRQALASYRRSLGDEHPDTAMVRANLALLLHDRRDFAAAETLLREAIAIQREQLGDEHPDLAISLNSLSRLLKDKGDYEPAEQVQRQALAIWRQSLGEDHPWVALALRSVGTILIYRGDYEAAEAFVRQALSIDRRVLEDSHPNLAVDLDSLGAVLLRRGDRESAEAAYREALATRRELFGNEHPTIAASLLSLAAVRDDEGDEDAAEPLYREALAMQRRLLGDDHPAVATTKRHLAALLARMGAREAAEPLARQALATYREELGEEHPAVIESLTTLAAVLHLAGAHDAADSLSREALDLARRRLGPHHPATASVLASQGRLLLDRERCGEAEPLLRRALEIRDRALPGRWLRAETRTLLGACLSQLGRFEEAEPLLLGGHQELRRSPGRRREIDRAVRFLAAHYERCGQGEKAAAYKAQLAHEEPPQPERRSG